MELSEETNTGVTIVAIAGRVDTQTAPDLGHRLSELLHAGSARLLIEASRLTYIGSAGLGKLLLFYKKLSMNNAVMKIEHPSEMIREVLIELRLDALFAIV